ncbi:MAG: hypothetical protein IBJ03_04290 [Gemmatimonadaceae bacterium]|nr:hypothetical protein [Gemmatimonadaceae bacterium]
MLPMFSGCRLLRPGPVEPFHPELAGHVRTASFCAAVCTDSVDIVAMGVGGFLIVPWRDTTQLVMTPPAYSNPGALRVALLDYIVGVRSNRSRVLNSVRRLAHADSARLSRVRAVLVGHGHYDHLMDLPTLAPWLPSARVYGSTTVQHLLHPVRATLPTESVEDRMSRSAQHPGAPIRISPNVTARAVAWSHAPNIWDFGVRYTIADAHQTTARETLPASARGWQMGTVLAWVLDIHDHQGNVVLRIFLHDSAAPREDMLRAVAVMQAMPRARTTVAMVIPANHDNAAGYPDVLLATLQPDHVLLAHWEDFFRRPSQPLRIVRAIDGSAFAGTLRKFVGTRWSALSPGAVLRVRTDSPTSP